ncbi:MAG: alpha-2-macroglobulin, partial [Chitinophagaceae bacterium]|nr:alpha-2-macroglobulin [Chitinophagaceae bacterium]
FYQTHQRYFNKPSLQNWSVTLPLTDDYKTHATEIKVPPVPLGHYALIVSESANWADDAYTAFSLFNASNISFVTQASEEDNNLNVFVIHRESGKPLNQVKVKLWRQEYDYQQRKSNYKEGSSFTTDINGLFKMNLSDDQNNSWNAEFAQGDDVYYSQDPLYKNRYYKQTNDNVRTFFFTDRSMYRPGQTIYFKGILIKSLAGDISKHELQKNKDVFVTLSNANGEVVKEMYLKTNEFGSYAGSVQATEGLLNGQFTLAGEGGQVTIHVEEYKRPKFEVSFDTLKGSYRLNEKVKLKGIAKAYAGNQIDGAQVKYRVYRTAMFPYSWCFYRWGQPSSPEMEIQHGSAVTKLDGSFDIEFTALPDLNIEKKTMPVFHYRVEADITDLNGETRHGNMNVPVSYQALQLSLNLPTQADFNDFNALEIKSTNLQGTHLSTEVTLTCKKLKSVEVTYRERLWPKIDLPSISLQDFRKDFPLDVYQDENNYLIWEVEKTVWSKTITTKENGVEYLQKIANQDAWYVIEARAIDQYGEEVIDKKYIRLSTYANPVVLPNEHMLVTEVQTKAEPGNKASISLSSAYDQINLLYQLNRRVNKTEWINLNGKKLIDFDIHEEDRGGFNVDGVFVKNNRVYNFHQFILVPWSNKELTITTETFRDKMYPGSEQEWVLTIKGDKKDKVSAELLTSMYDASLDAFQSHGFNKPALFNLRNKSLGFAFHYCFQSHQGVTIGNPPYKSIEPYEKNYGSLQSFGLLNDYGGGYYRRGLERGMVTEAVMMDEAAAPMANMTKSLASTREESGEIKFMPPAGAAKNKALSSTVTGNEDLSSGPRKNIEVRSNFSETAFFFPQMHTDAEGNIRFKFKAPDALTKWKMMSFAHTQDLKMGMLESFSVTQKQLMIVPQTPRFLREGDLMEYSAKVTNLSSKKLSVKTSLELFDAFTMDSRNLVFNLTKPNVNIDIPAGESRAIGWTVRVPEGFTNPVLIKTLADAGEFTDGEQQVVPVLLNSMLVTETMPLPVRANTSKSFTFDKLLNSFQSSSLRQHSLTVEYTGNPAWYAIQALPYLTDYPYECAEQTFNRYYANVLATHMANAYPQVKEIFSTWKAQDTAALLSNLEKNQELKNALLQETPWVLEAKSESAQKQQLANLFNLTRMSKELERTIRELEIMQTPNGGFAWFKGMPDDRFITQYILTGLGRLLHLGVSEVGSERRIMQIIDKAIPYVDARLKEDYQQLIKYKADLKKQQISYTQIQYLYMRSFFVQHPVTNGTQVAFDFYKKQAGQFWLSQNKYMQGMSALALFRFADIPKAEAILKSLRENAIRNEEMGMYWKDLNNSYWWYEAPIEAQSILVEAFQEIGGDDDEVDELKIWLLKNKQTQNWKTTKATADACYALMLKGNEWLVQSPEVDIQLGKELIQSKNMKTEAGTGYFKKTYNAEQVKPDMGDIRVKVSSAAKGTSWGAVYWQYFERLDKITYAATPLSLRKDLYLIKNSDKGPVLDKIKDESIVKVGDQIKVRIELRVDRDMEYVHLKDMRGACFEPINVISQYKYQGGLGYYESTKDANTSFFFHWLPKGTYVFEYPMTVTNKGDYSNGIATIQCMYAPEFSSHSAGVRVKVK